MIISNKDKTTLRQLANEYIEIAKSDEMSQVISLWYSHNKLERKRPMVLFESFPLQKEFIETLSCESEFTRSVELDLRSQIWHFHNVRDDRPVMPYYPITWEIPFLQFGGMEIKEKKAIDSNGRKTAHVPEHPIKNLETDLGLLKPLDFFVDKKRTHERLDSLNDCFGDILPAVIRGRNFWTLGLTVSLISLIGLEGFFMGMYDYPDKIHELMKFLMEEKLGFMKFMEDGGMLTLNNEGDYYCVGSYGFTNDLPQKDFTGKVRTKDLWLMLESQETSSVSPGHYEEFVFPYYMKMSAEFGKLYYGCCEPLENIWHLVKQYHNLTALSISPWCDQEKMADNLKGNYIFSRKPMPTLVSTSDFNEEAIKKDLMYTVKTASQCELELVMKDVHTVNYEHRRMGRWVELARQAVDKYYG